MRALWNRIRNELRRAGNRIAQAARAINQALFSSTDLGAWLRLGLFVAAALIFILGFFPFLDFLSRLLTLWAEKGYPEVRNSLKNLWEMAFPPPPEAPPAPAPWLPAALPQPGWREALRSLTANPFLFDMIQRITVVALPSGLALFFTAFYFQYLHRTRRFLPTLVYLLRALFPLPKPHVRLAEGRAIQPVGELSLYRFGGPARVSCDGHTAGVFENRGGQARLLQNGQPQSIGVFETLRTALFLDSFELEVDAQGRTRDGIRLAARGARFRCQLYRPPGNPGRNLRAVAMKMVYRHWLGNNWEQPAKRLMDVRDLVMTELLDYMAQRDLVEFLGSIVDRRAGSQFAAFAAQFSQQAGRYAGEAQPTPLLRLEWLGEGSWEIIPELNWQAQMDAWQLWAENRLRKAKPTWNRLAGEVWQSTVRQRVEQLGLETLAAAGAAQQPPPQNITRAVLEAYQQALAEIRQLQPAPDQTVQNQIDLVLSHINRLLRSL